jgi:hypothetical protein
MKETSLVAAIKPWMIRLTGIEPQASVQKSVTLHSGQLHSHNFGGGTDISFLPFPIFRCKAGGDTEGLQGNGTYPEKKKDCVCKKLENR